MGGPPLQLSCMRPEWSAGTRVETTTVDIVDASGPIPCGLLLFSADNPAQGDGQTRGAGTATTHPSKSTASGLVSWLSGCLFADWDPQQMEETSSRPAWGPGLTATSL